MPIVAFGALFLLFAWLSDDQAVRFTPSRVLVVLAVEVAVLLSTAAVTIRIFGHPTQEAFKDISVWQGLLACFEDCMFVLPALMMREDRRDRWSFLLLSSVVFTMGHSYQGYGAMLAKVFVIPVTYLMAAEWGILTTMAAHSLMDTTALTLIHRLKEFH